MRLRSPSWRALKCRSKKMFSTEGPHGGTRSNHIKSSAGRLGAFSKNSLPEGFPICSKETDMKDRSASTCCVADGQSRQALKVRPSRRSHPTPAPADQLFSKSWRSKSSAEPSAGLARGSLESAAHSHRSSIATRRSAPIGFAIHQQLLIGVKCLRQLFQQQRRDSESPCPLELWN